MTEQMAVAAGASVTTKTGKTAIFQVKYNIKQILEMSTIMRDYCDRWLEVEVGR